MTRLINNQTPAILSFRPEYFCLNLTAWTEYFSVLVYFL